jgi:hypothetical protein
VKFLVIEGGVAGRAGAMRAVAPSMPPHACPQQGRQSSRQRPTPTAPIKPDIFTLLRCTSGELFFPSCGSVAALALVNCNEHVAEANTSRPHPPTSSVLCTVPKAREV